MTPARPALLLAAVALLAACTTTDPGTATADPAGRPESAAPTVTTGELDEESAPEPAPAPAVEFSERDLEIVEIGEPIDLGQGTATATVTGTAVDPGCTSQWASPPSRGHFVVVDITVEVHQTAGTLNITPFDFGIISADGVGEGDSASIESYSCMDDADQFPIGGMRSGTTYHARITLDTAHASGVVTFDPMFGIRPAGNGWEWEY
ncbi:MULTISPECIES: hypothetical protein [Actinoalloteichus]|uniref:Lipoprotein n=1 Tax=Actinoalloteichus fjordicus TaxID=1612552 RepID=A0AAC9LEW4_9PSEU|nr:MULTISPECIES: hypothetical protein [Actinoalloteichus]APU15594.1 hypothetical protein UA74_17830 [Actinoalloteichus fjordicus]APU21654.1 hypothetical protein UA75_18320 [Actinoalloteichus sp. GBA129-24]